MSEYMDNELFDWDSEIESDGQEYITVEPGDYVFTVKSVERKQFPGSDKMPACNMVQVNGEIPTPKGPATFRENLYLTKRNEWKLSGYFRCLGMKKHGEKLRMDFPGSIGRKGYAKFVNRVYNGNTYNQVDKFYDYDPAKMNGGNGGGKYTEVKDDEVPW